MLIVPALLAAGVPARTFRVDYVHSGTASEERSRGHRVGSERYILTFDNRAFRDLASHAPYELVEIVANSRTYGGGGIFNLYGTVAADSRWAPYILVHEFAHHLAGLADEYFTSPTAYEKQAERPEPWERNVTADPHHPKWATLLTPGVPLPTPWDVRFCAACRAAIDRILDLYAPRKGLAPGSGPAELRRR